MVNQFPILEYGLQALGNIVALAEELESFRPAEADYPEPPFQMVGAKRIAEILRDLCEYQAAGYNSLFDHGNRTGEAAEQRKLRLDRVARFTQACEGIDISELRNRGARNALAHFDDRYLKALMRDERAPRLIDVAVSNFCAFEFEGPPLLIRAYFYDTDALHIFDEVLYPGRLKLQAAAVLDRVGAKIVRDDQGRPIPRG